MRFVDALLLATVFFTICFQAVANNNPNSDVKDNSLEYVRTVEGVQEYSLPNGMQVLLYPDKSESRTFVNLVYKVGSVHEGYGESGMAHLLEHLLFKGSSAYPDYNGETNRRGIWSNASTWSDRTNYFARFEYNYENLAWYLAMEADRVYNATFSSQDLASEMTVVRNEMESGQNNPVSVLGKRMSATSYQWHNYAKPTIGLKDNLEKMPFEALRAFYKTHYRTDNSVLVISGRFEQEKTLKLIANTFGQLTAPSEPLAPLYTEEPPQDGERMVTLRTQGDVPAVGLRYHIPSAMHADTPAIQLLMNVLSQSTNGRLAKNFVETGMASKSYASAGRFFAPSTASVFAIGFKDKDLSLTEEKLIDYVENLANTPVTEQELRRAKISALKSIEKTFRSAINVGYGITEYIAMGDYRYMFYYRDLIEKVSVEDINHVATKYFTRSNRTLGRYVPTATPQRVVIEKDDSIQKELTSYLGREGVEQGEVYDNTVSNISRRLKTFNWPNGAKASIYPRKLTAGQILMEMRLPVGNEESLTGYVEEFGLMGKLLLKGNKHYSKDDISLRLDELRATLAIDTSQLGEMVIKLTAEKKYLNDTLALVAELLASPTFPEHDTELLVKKRISQLNGARQNPSTLSYGLLRNGLVANNLPNPKAYSNIDQDISALKKVTAKRIAALFNQHLSFNNATISVIGDVIPKKISNQLEGYFNNFTGDVAYQYIDTNYKKVTGLVQAENTRGKANATVYVAHSLTLSPFDKDYAAVYLANKLFGGSFNSRVTQRIREKEGFSYSVSTKLKLSKSQAQGLFYLKAISAPQNVEKVVAAYKEEVNKVLSNGFTQKELTDAVAGELESMKSKWSKNSYVLSVLNEAQKYNKNLDWYQQWEMQLMQLTVDDINRAFKTYLVPAEFNVFSAGDFEQQIKH